MYTRQDVSSDLYIKNVRGRLNFWASPSQYWKSIQLLKMFKWCWNDDMISLLVSDFARSVWSVPFISVLGLRVKRCYWIKNLTAILSNLMHLFYLTCNELSTVISLGQLSLDKLIKILPLITKSSQVWLISTPSSISSQ